MYYAITAEKALLGTILRDNFYLAEANTRITPNDLSATHAVILEKINLITSNGIKADKISLLDAGIEGLNSEYIDHLISIGSEKDIDSYLEAIEAEKLKRMVEHEYDGLRDLIRSEGMNRDKIAEAIQSSTTKVVNSVTRDNGTVCNIRDRIKDTVEKIKENAKKGSGITGLASGFPDLDALTQGFQSTDLIIVGARPAMGKTTLSYNFAENACLQSGVRGMFFSLEMPTEQILYRSFANLGGINQSRVKAGKMSQFEYAKFEEAIKQVDKMDLVIDDQGGLSVHELKLRARKEHAKKPLQFILVDYLQLLKAPEAGINRTLEISIISSELKNLAKELEIPVIVLAQLNRSLENRADKRPIPSDLKESGAIEQDADIIMFVYRDEVYHEDSPDKGIAEVIIGKHRGGPLGTVRLSFQGEFSRFSNIAKVYEPEEERPLPANSEAVTAETLINEHF